MPKPRLIKRIHPDKLMDSPITKLPDMPDYEPAPTPIDEEAKAADEFFAELNKHRKFSDY